MQKAWKTEVLGVTHIVFAATRSKARYTTYLAANRAGQICSLTIVRVLRAKDYDNAQTVDGRIPRERNCYPKTFLVKKPTNGVFYTSKESSEKEMAAICNAIKASTVTSDGGFGKESVNLEVEIFWSAMSYLKQNPRASIEEACNYGVGEWVK